MVPPGPSLRAPLLEPIGRRWSMVNLHNIILISHELFKLFDSTLVSNFLKFKVYQWSVNQFTHH